MQLQIFSIFDKAVGAYMRPFVAQSAGEALRAFEDDCMNAESPVAKHPEDYSLFMLGEFDNQDGSIEAKASPVCLANAHEVVARSRTKFFEDDRLNMSVEQLINGDDEENVNAT